MPAMSPTMSSGSISRWNVKEGDSFAAGDVLLVVETDKAEVDIEAQDDGVLGKILLGDGSKDIDVGKVIAYLAEEGDDLSDIESKVSKSSSSSSSKSESKSSDSANTTESKSPSDSSTSSPSQSASSDSSPPQKSPPKPSHGIPKHSQPLFPSVLRLLVENGIEDATKMKGTGHRGKLTKGDVLKELGMIKDELGSFRKLVKSGEGLVGGGGDPKGGRQKEDQGGKKSAPAPPLDGPSLRRLIATGLSAPSTPSVIHQLPASSATSFDEIISGYFPSVPKPRKPPSSSSSSSKIPPPPPTSGSRDVWADLIQ